MDPAPNGFLPPGLKENVSCPQTPWNLSKKLFKELRSQKTDRAYKLCPISTKNTKEYDFVRKMFVHSKPPKYHIGQIFAIHNRNITSCFEENLERSERQASEEKFKPSLSTLDPDYIHRLEVIAQWKEVANTFFPIKVLLGVDQRECPITQPRVLPLWHGTSENTIQTICELGFECFGKHHITDSHAEMGPNKITDIGYFGNGIYLTNSAHCASMYGSKCLILSFASMRTPFPVVSDALDRQQECSDMKMLKGKGAYQNYNAHFIPVMPKDENNPKCVDYYPCFKGQKASWFELVVFSSSQVLPRYYVLLAPDMTKNLSDAQDLYQTPDAGINVDATCKNNSCSLSDKKIVIKRGNGSFNLGEIFSTLECPCCNNNQVIMHAIVFKNCSYSYSGVDKTGNKVQGKNLTLIDTFQLSTTGWKYLQLKAAKIAK